PRRLAAPAADTPQWTIVLGTFSGDGHADVARNAQREIAAQVPQLASARVHSTDRGSMLLFGRYAAADDPRAAEELNRVKQLRLLGQPAFARAFLSPMPGSSRSPRAAAPHELMSVRQRHPNVDPLYTLQVAVWGDFESGRLSMDEVRRQAETYVQQLRAQGM